MFFLLQGKKNCNCNKLNSWDADSNTPIQRQKTVFIENWEVSYPVINNFV